MFDYILLEKYSKNISILFVEDDVSIRKETKDLLEEIFGIVDVCVDGESGIKQYMNFYKKNNKFYDIVLTDLIMPNINGIELIKMIYSQNRKQKVLVLSASSESEYLIELVNMGIKQFIPKPIEYNKFLEIIFDINKRLYLQTNQNQKEKEIYLEDKLYWNKESNVLVNNDVDVKLTKKELILISLLIKNLERLSTNEEILLKVWEGDYKKTPDISNLKNVISRLRKKVPSLIIENIYGLGYKIKPKNNKY